MQIANSVQKHFQLIQAGSIKGKLQLGTQEPTSRNKPDANAELGVTLEGKLTGDTVPVTMQC